MPTHPIKTFPILGLPVAVLNYAEACEWAFEKAHLRDRAYAVEAANAHVLALSRHEQEFGAQMRKFDLVCPDGMPLVWSLNRLLSNDEQLTDRVYGPTLMLEMFERGQEEGMKHFILGGKEETLEKLSHNLKEKFPCAELAGVYSPPFGDWPADEFERICKMISSSGANIVWVGLGCPKQERWIADHLKDLPAAVYYGIGAAVAFHAGEVRQAPALVQKIGMEWLFRLCAEPKRLWKRYVVYNSLFIYYTLKDVMTSDRAPEAGLVE